MAWLDYLRLITSPGPAQSSVTLGIALTGLIERQRPAIIGLLFTERGSGQYIRLRQTVDTDAVFQLRCLPD
jgi:hypothetical protein